MWSVVPKHLWAYGHINTGGQRAKGQCCVPSASGRESEGRQGSESSTPDQNQFYKSFLDMFLNVFSACLCQFHLLRIVPAETVQSKLRSCRDQQSKWDTYAGVVSKKSPVSAVVQANLVQCVLVELQSNASSVFIFQQHQLFFPTMKRTYEALAPHPWLFPTLSYVRRNCCQYF